MIVEEMEDPIVRSVQAVREGRRCSAGIRRPSAVDRDLKRVHQPGNVIRGQESGEHEVAAVVEEKALAGERTLDFRRHIG